MTAAAVFDVESIGWRLALAERQRQTDVEGYRDALDDTYTNRELYAAAQCYRYAFSEQSPRTATWPWSSDWWKPRGRVDNLTRATALLIAESDRLQRAGNLSAAHRVRGEALALAEGLTNLVVAQLRATAPTTLGDST